MRDKSTFNGKNKNKIDFIEIETIQNASICTCLIIFRSHQSTKDHTKVCHKIRALAITFK